GLVMHYLRKTADKFNVNGNVLSTQTLFAAQSEKAYAYQSNIDLLKQVLDSGEPVFVVAPLAAYQPHKHESPKFVPIAHFHGIPRMRIDPEEWDEIVHENMLVFDLWRQGMNAVA